MKLPPRAALAAAAGALTLAAGAGFLTSQAMSAGSQATRTVTVDVATGPAGPPGPPGPRGEPGPAGGTTCSDGFSLADVVINAPNGQVELEACVKD